jgi:hypothetical protein
MRSRFIPRLQHRRRLIQATLPTLRQALLPIAILDFRNYRELGGSNRTGEIVSDRKRIFPKSGRLRFLLSLSREQRVGKI